MKRAVAILGVLAACMPASSARSESPKPSQALGAPALKSMVDNQGGAIFRGLDKITARVSTIYAPLDVPVPYGSLSLTVRQCKARPPEEPPEKAAFVEIDEQKAGKDAVHEFTGWMFWSSPALNALQHPVYDVWLIDCQKSAAERTAEAAAAAAAAAASAQEEREEGSSADQTATAPSATEETPAESEGDDAPLNLPPETPQ
jgi:hypothetical protein